VEGSAGGDNLLDHRFELLQHIDCGDAQNRYALIRKPIVALRVTPWAITHVVGHSIDLDSKFRTFAVEIEHIAAAGMLASEFQPFWPLPQNAPEQPLGQCHRAAQRPCLDDRFPRRLEHHPSTMLRMVPLP